MSNSAGVVAMIWTFAVPLIICLTAPSVSTASALNTNCGEFSSEAIKDCLAEGEKFISTYVKRQLEKRHVKKGKTYHKCRSYKKFDDCIKPIIDGCPEVKHGLRHHWQPVIDTMTSVCGDEGGQTEKAIKAVNCSEEEYDSVFSYQCDQYYEFNVKQGTQHICHFVHESLHCKEALVASACGSEAGLFSFHLLKLHSDQQLTELGISKCHVTKDPSYGGLRYDKHNCPRDMVSKIDHCSNLYLTDDMIVDFRQESDVIILKEHRKRLGKACSAIEEYNQCLKPIKDACPHGAKTIFDYAEPLKKYLLKMDLICQPTVLEVYQKNAKCMNNDVLDGSSLSQCDDHWQVLAKVLGNVTSFLFYCDSTHHSALALMSELQNLGTCYRRVFEETCPGTGDLIQKLLQKVFQDPVYLRFNFKPDCDLHRFAIMNDKGETPGEGNSQKSTTLALLPTPKDPQGPSGSKKPEQWSPTRKPTPPYRDRDKPALKPGKEKEQNTDAKSSPVSSTSTVGNVPAAVIMLSLMVNVWIQQSHRSS